MIPTAADSDGTHPLNRIADALEKISYDLDKITKVIETKNHSFDLSNTR